MRFSRIWAIIVAEMRSCRRLIRTWVFVAVATLSGAFIFLLQHLTNLFSSYVSPSVGTAGPQFTISSVGRMILLWFTLGIVFLAFDIRTRDIRDRIGEVIDTRPMSNLELLTGRLLGIVLLLTIPIVVLIVSMWMFGIVAEAANIGFGAARESASVAAFLVWDILPNLLLWGSLTIVVAIVVRFRLLVVLAMAGLIFGYYSLSTRIPFFLAPALSTYTGLDSLPSALAPQFATAYLVLNRIFVVVLAIALLAVAAGMHPRQMERRTRPATLAAGLTAALVAVLGVGGLLQGKLSGLNQLEHWSAIHAADQLDSSTDIQAIRGSIEIFPGRKIDLDLRLDLNPVQDSKTDTWLFSLNPGYKIKSVSIDGAASSAWHFNDGLLRVESGGKSQSGSELHLVATGVPNGLFAYLDSSLKWKDMDYVQALGAVQYGTKSYVFHPQYVALVPGVSWLPASGTAYGRTNQELRPQDFFDVDVEVTVPRNWTVAGPGTRTVVEQSNRTTFRFNPSVPIPEVALLTSKFERRAMTVGGTEFELLLSKKHTRNLDTFEDVVPALSEWVAERLESARRLGLEYPYGSLSLVEVPVSLRVYGGGWRMASIYSPPGIHMIRESGFPIAKFDYVINAQEQDLEDASVDRGEFMLELLQTYFDNDFNGGNPKANLVQQLVAHHTKSLGSGATATDFLINEIARQFVFEGIGYFSLHAGLSGNRVADVSNSLISAGDGFGVTPRLSQHDWFEDFVDKPSVWERASTTPLSKLDLEGDPTGSYHVMLLKSNAIVRLIQNTFSEEAIGAFLGQLIAEHKGSVYTGDDMRRVMSESGLILEDTLGDWLHSDDLPGFLVSRTNLVRLKDNEQGEAVYQASFFIRNDEPVPGVVVISYTETGDSNELEIDPLPVPSLTSLQVAIQGRTPISSIKVDPLLSLNRSTIQLSLPETEDYERTDTDALELVTEVDWLPSSANSVIVDDLDDGFVAIGTQDPEGAPFIPKWMQYLFGDWDAKIEMDGNLPYLDDALGSLSANPFGTALWYRESEPTSYGKYRRTQAVNFFKSSETSATFTASLPRPGHWKLEYHLPNQPNKIYRSSYSPEPGSIISYSRPFRLGKYDIAVVSDSTDNAVEFDANEATRGWNEIGVYGIEGKVVDVVVTPITTSGWLTIGDAVKWTLVEDTELSAN